MENKPSNLHESLWRRRLSEAERADLRSRPELELEARLTHALSKIPDVPVPSNFATGVLNAIELEEKQSARAVHWNWRVLIPRLAVAAAITVFVAVGAERHEASLRRAQLAENLAQIAATQTPSVDALENLDAIQRLSQSGHADNELLAALQ